MSENERQILSSASFLSQHPDLKYRLEGWASYDEGRFEEARKYFLRSARFADKWSQAMLAEMAWDGRSGAVDRAQAYAWADLAAERGYRKLVILRERYWQALDEAERQRAIEIGKALYAEYGDEAAKPRIASKLRRARWSMIGRRPRHDTQIVVPDRSGSPIYIDGAHFFAPKFWEPELYQAWVDETWNGLPEGRVDIGDIRQDESGE